MDLFIIIIIIVIIIIIIIRDIQQEMHQVKNQYLNEKLDEMESSISGKTLRAVDCATQKGASSWLTVLPIRDMDLNKSEFRDNVKPRHDWEVLDTPSVCVCEEIYHVNHVMICKRGGFVSSNAIMNWGIWRQRLAFFDMRVNRMQTPA